MEPFRSLGKRDIFGIILPGTILVFASMYAIFGVLSLLQLRVDSLLKQEFLLTIVLFAVSYLAGSLLRLFATDDVDSRSSVYLLKAWHKEYRAKIEAGAIRDFGKYRAELAKGEDISNVPEGFDDQLFDGWLCRVDELPYPAWQNRKWQAHGPRRVLEFFRGHYKTSLWSGTKASPKSFFRYCKLTVVQNSGPLADEISAAEGQTRFFAGTFVALRLSVFLLTASLIIQLLLGAMLILAPYWGIRLALPVRWTFQGFYLAFTLVLLFISRWMRHRIVERFRIIRASEVETVYYAFHLCLTSRLQRATDRDQAVSQRVLT